MGTEWMIEFLGFEFSLTELIIIGGILFFICCGSIIYSIIMRRRGQCCCCAGARNKNKFRKVNSEQEITFKTVVPAVQNAKIEEEEIEEDDVKEDQDEDQENLIPNVAKENEDEN